MGRPGAVAVPVGSAAATELAGATPAGKMAFGSDGRGNRPAAASGTAAWSSAIVESSAAPGVLPGSLGLGLRLDMPATGGGDVLVGGAGDDLLVGGEGQNLLVGGYAANRPAEGDPNAANALVASAAHFGDDYFLAYDNDDGP